MFSPMHQDVFLTAMTDEYMEYSEITEELAGSLYPTLRRIAFKLVRIYVDYADDWSDPMEYTMYGSSESEFEGEVDFPLEDCARGTT